MIRFALLFQLVICFLASAQFHNCIVPGEKIVYNVHYGFIDAGEVVVLVDTLMYSVEGNTCYKLEAIGRTKGAVGLFAKIHNTYTSYVDTTTLLSTKFIRTQQENNFSLYESTTFNRASNEALVTRRKDDNSFELKTFKISQTVQDLISTYFMIRGFETKELKYNDTLQLKLFLEDTTLKIGIKYLGKERMRSVLGKQASLVFSPIIPPTPNTILTKENPIKIWMTDDKNRIPIKIQAKTKWGAIEVDLVSSSLVKKRKRFLFF